MNGLALLTTEPPLSPFDGLRANGNANPEP
jgi:hypothetical protein